MTPFSTTAEIAADTKVSKRTVRDVAADLGYIRGKGRRALIFSPAQAQAVREAIQCQHTIPPVPAEEIPPTLSEDELTVRSERSALAAETRLVRRTIGMRSSAASSNVVSLEAERRRPLMTRFDSTKPRGI